MEYIDDALPTLSNIEEMAKAYRDSLKQKGFIFINLEEEGKNILIDEVFILLFKLRSSYRYMKGFLGSQNMLSLTEKHIDTLRNAFSVENNRGYIITCNPTKCFLNTVALERELITKLLLLSQKCEYGEELLSLIIERNKEITNNLLIENAMYCQKT